MRTGENIRRHREALRLSLEDVAGQVGISRQTLSRYETGKITNIPQENIEALAKVLQTTPSTLVGWTDHRASDLRLMGDQIALLYYNVLD